MEPGHPLQAGSWGPSSQTGICEPGSSTVYAQLCLTLCNPRTAGHQAPLSMEFFRQEYWSGLPFPTSRDLPDPGIEPVSFVLAGGFYH